MLSSFQIFSNFIDFKFIKNILVRYYAHPSQLR